MIRGNFLSAAERERLVRIVRRPSEQHGIGRRANALLLLDDGLSCSSVAKVLYLDDDTIRGWHKSYVAGGWEALQKFDWKGGSGHLSAAQEAELKVDLSAAVHRSTTEIRAHILARYGVAFSRPGCIKLLHRLGFQYKKPKGLPAQGDAAAQQAFIEKYEKLLRAMADDEVLYFVDGVHPEHQSRPSHGWIRKGDKVAVRRTAGRQRLNLHGALNLENFHCPIVAAERINAASTIALFEKLEAANPRKRWIYAIVDNAGYHRAKAVREWLARPGCRIQPIFLPSYAPNLNAIERLWGVMHREVTHNKCYATFDEFAAAITEFFAETIPKRWTEFRDTVTDNFRVISHQDFRVLE